MKHSRKSAAVALLLLLVAVPASAQTLCGAPNPPIGDDEPRVREKDFNAKSYGDALEYLQNEFPKLLERLKTEDLLNTEAMYGFGNSLIAIEGYVLLQQAQLRRAERDLVRQKTSSQGTANRNAVAAANARLDQARSRFCRFLNNTHYVD